MWEVRKTPGRRNSFLEAPAWETQQLEMLGRLKFREGKRPAWRHTAEKLSQ